MPRKPDQHTDDLRRLGVLAPRIEGDTAYRRTRRQDAEQAEVDRLRSTTQWRRVRAMVLKAEPLCRDCAARGLTTPGAQVDHIAPLTDRPDLAYDLTNLQPLCAPCHNRKTGRERVR